MVRVLTLMLVASLLGACATHRGDPPKCKGPYTPINSSTAAVSDAT